VSARVASPVDDLSALGPVDAVLFDAGGVFIVPSPEVVRAALGVEHDDDDLVAAHYRATAALDAAAAAGNDRWAAYFAAYAESVSWPGPHEVVADLWQGRTSDLLWVHRVDDHATALADLVAGGVRVGIVSNSDGTVEAILSERQVCQVGPGGATEVLVIVDSTVHGVAKPDPAIFAPALAALGTAPDRTLYVGDSRYYDVGGATAAGLVPVLVDPLDLGGGPACARISSLRTLVDHLLAS
jgi:FMN phosphatase YigB (HAD superfamily)